MTKLWSMFFFCVMLVATMNWYAVVREPDIVEVEDLYEHVNSVVKVRGELISWVEDPWSSGEDKINIVIQDDTGVVAISWSNTQPLPPVGSIIEARGDYSISATTGKKVVYAKGTGSVTWNAEDVAEPIEYGAHLTELSQNPENYTGKLITLNGHISKTLNPDTRLGSFDLRDHPEYSGSNYFLKVMVYGSTNVWIESSSKVNVTGTIVYSERDLQWIMYAQGTEIEVDNSYQSVIGSLDWNNPSSWQYEVYSLVSIYGKMVQDSDGEWWIEGPNEDDKICASPSNFHLENNAVAILNKTDSWIGRYMWPEDKSYTCLMMGVDAGSATLVTSKTLSEIVNNPHEWLGNNETVTVEGWLTTTISPTYDEGSIGDGPTWNTRNTELNIHLSGSREKFLEEGLRVRVSGKVVWDVSSTSMVLEVDTLEPLDYWTVNGVPTYAIPLPAELSWFDGPTAWFWDALGGSRVYISGHLNITENGTYIEQAGSNKRLCVDLNPGYDVSEILEDGNNRTSETYTFIGRLYQKNAADDGAIQLCLDSTTPDLDGDLLSHEDELELGTNISNSDSDGDGIDDGQEVSFGTNPLSLISESDIQNEQSETNTLTNENNTSTNEEEIFNNTSSTNSEGLDLPLIMNWILGYIIISVGFFAIIRIRNNNSYIGENNVERSEYIGLLSEREEEEEEQEEEEEKEENSYESMTLKELKEILKSKGLKISGKKKELIERLKE